MVQGVSIEKGYIVNINPATGEAIQPKVKVSTNAEVDAAVAAAGKAQAAWTQRSLAERTELVKKAVKEIGVDKAGLARQITIEMGKTLAESEEEVDDNADKDDYCELVRQANEPEIHGGSVIHRHAHGVVSVCAPWNYPVEEIVLLAVPALIAASASASQGGDQGAGGGALGRWIVANRSLLLLVCLVVHKCSTDGLTRYTRLAGAYSGNTVAVMSEIVKFPLIATAIASFGGGVKEVVPTFKAALTSTPFSNCWIALCYTFNNLLYFDALGALSAVAYQVLSQSKTLFTAGLMYFIVGKRLIFRQILAIGMLIGGALLVQFEELARSVAGSAATAATSAVMATGPLGMPLVYWGAALTLFSSLISALPNVAYEKVLKTEGENQWVNNIQVCACVSALPACRRLLLSLSPCLALLPRPVSAWVCVVCRVGR